MSEDTIIDKGALLDYDGGTLYAADDTFEQMLNGQEEEMTLLPLENDVFFPYLQVGIMLKKPEDIAAVKMAHEADKKIFFFLASDVMVNDPAVMTEDDVVLSRGCIGYVSEISDVENEGVMVMATMGPRGIITAFDASGESLVGRVMYQFPQRIEDNFEERSLERRLEKDYGEVVAHLSDDDKKRLQGLIGAFPQDSVRRFNFMMQNSPLDADNRYVLLEAHTLSEQRKKFIKMLEKEKRSLNIRMDIHRKTMGELGQRQRDEFLRTQMQQIKNELGENDESEIDELRLKAEYMEWSDSTRARFDKELNKLTKFNPTSADYAIQYSYVESLLSLPWLHCDNSDFTLEQVERTLDDDHYGLEKVKERIIEHMAVIKLRKDTKSPILCLYGPPGVGKTSLGKSVAKALGRKYARVALGGLHDESEIRGHRRTYLGSMPGRIINALENCGTSDPVMVLDEIDKIGADYKGDPSHALLEVLDPEQNCKFHDNYVDIDYDLSKVLFIATANSLQSVSSPLLDRMELVEIGGYVESEKIEIAKRHLIPKDLEEHGFDRNEISFTDDALLEIIKSYTRESGVRRLEKKICKILRKQARLKASGKPFNNVIDKATAIDCLGSPEVFNDQYESNEITGVVTGLAWTQAGGEILFIESSVSSGKDGKLTLTGNLGDVMKESAVIALQYVKANHDRFGISEKNLEFGTMHVHVPEGAVPKDGPSAGITIATSIASTLSGRKVRSHLAMTGEITLRGKILPVGGIKEKILAAKRSGIKTVMLCEKNRKDVQEIKPEYLSGLSFHFVESVADALDFALLP